jgi:hypothetical protein
MEPNGSSRRTIALYGGDSAASGFIPGLTILWGPLAAAAALWRRGEAGRRVREPGLRNSSAGYRLGR